jgi:RNA ligase
MKLYQYLDTEKLVDHVKSGIVEVRCHKTLPLKIYCYSKRATFESIWDDVTCKTRGIIVTNDGDVVARPFEKFFNFDTSFRPETLPAALAAEAFAPYVQDKLDGSMGTYWEYDGHFGIATKGSFHSEQAEWATQWLQEHYSRTKLPRYWMHPYTPVFEIICQKIQHHVCHYEPKDDNTLRLIGMVNRQSGEELLGRVLEHQASINGLEAAHPIRVALEKFDYGMIGLLECLLEAKRPGKEGFVLSWARSGAPPVKVKIKHEEFLRLQKIAHYTTPKVVFEYVRDGNYTEINEVVRLAPPWLSSQVKEWVTNYQDAHDRISGEARYIVSLALSKCTTRKEFAAYFLQPEYKDLSAVLFNILDEKDYKKTAWDLVEPLVKAQKFSEVEAEG